MVTRYNKISCNSQRTLKDIKTGLPQLASGFLQRLWETKSNLRLFIQWISCCSTKTTFRCIRAQTYFYFIIRKRWYLSFLQPTSSLMGQSHFIVSHKGAWCCKKLVVARWFWNRSPGNVSPNNLGLAWSVCSHSQTDKKKYANNRSLIYKCRQITNTLHLIWVSLLQWMNLVSHVSVSSRRLDSAGCILVLFLKQGCEHLHNYITICSDVFELVFQISIVLAWLWI